MNSCSALPPSDVNCGWFTGTPFKAGAGWACVPVVPDSHHLLTKTLLSANPPPNATLQYQENNRPGNHCQKMSAVGTLHSPYDSLGCVKSEPATRIYPNPKFRLFATF